MDENIIQVAVDAYHGKTIKYSVDESMDMLRKAMIEANNGSTKLDYRAIRDGKASGLFSLVEEILARTVVEGLQGDEYFNTLMDFRNIAAGDEQAFDIEDSDLFVVSNAADGTQAIRRQRIGGVEQIIIPTSIHIVKFYEELKRVLAGQVDLNRLIQKVGESVRQTMLNDAYALWMSATQDDLGGKVYYPSAGNYDEDTLLDIVSHVEAAAGGKPATIIGTKRALRNLMPAIQGSDAKSDLYNLGYFGKFYGTNVVATPQRHKIGSTEFVFDDKVLTVIAGDEKPIKCVYEGNPLIIPGELYKNQDLTQEYLYGESYGMGLVLASGAGIGRYKITE